MAAAQFIISGFISDLFLKMPNMETQLFLCVKKYRKSPYSSYSVQHLSLLDQIHLVVDDGRGISEKGQYSSEWWKVEVAMAFHGKSLCSGNGCISRACLIWTSYQNKHYCGWQWKRWVEKWGKRGLSICMVFHLRKLKCIVLSCQSFINLPIGREPQFSWNISNYVYKSFTNRF